MSGNVNLGAMIRLALGEIRPQEGARALELRAGQVVRGVLVQMLDGQEGIVNINGVPVRARLETEIPVGRGVPLLVQPGPDGGTIVLKPLPGWPETVSDESLRNLLRAFGLPEQPWSFALLHGLKRDGYPLDAATARTFAALAGLKPPHVDAAQWMAAADVVFRRGLPATADTVASLRQVLFGQPLQTQMRELRHRLDDALAASEGSGAAWTEAAKTLRRLLAEGNALLEAGGKVFAGAPRAAGDAAAGGMAAAVKAAAGRTGTAAMQSQTALQPANLPAPEGDASGGIAAAAGGHRAAETAARTMPQPPDQPGASVRPANGQHPPAVDAGRAAPSAPRADSAPGEGGRHAGGEMAARPAATSASPSGAAFPVPDRRDGAGWLARWWQWLGIGHEHSLALGGTRAAFGNSPTPMTAFGQGAADAASGLGPLAADGNPAAAGASSAAGPGTSSDVPEETLKSALLALAAREDSPAPLREAAQSLAQHITGQQLLMTGERATHAPFHHLTLFIPLRDENGDTTATVHVQTRKGRRGEWDAANVRLLFDLRMRHLGPTVVDVQVVDRIVSLRLLNDDPWFRKLAEESRDMLTDALQEAGYQLSSLKAVPFPAKNGQDPGPFAGVQPAEPDGTSLFHAAGSVSGTPPAGAFASRPYKGVDLRI